jgi:hypothetical protein
MVSWRFLRLYADPTHWLSGPCRPGDQVLPELTLLGSHPWVLRSYCTTTTPCFRHWFVLAETETTALENKSRLHGDSSHLFFIHMRSHWGNFPLIRSTVWRRWESCAGRLWSDCQTGPTSLNALASGTGSSHLPAQNIQPFPYRSQSPSTNAHRLISCSSCAVRLLALLGTWANLLPSMERQRHRCRALGLAHETHE